jgi:hypothetical protein
VLLCRTTPRVGACMLHELNRTAQSPAWKKDHVPAAPQLFDKWREADAAARTAEKGVFTASLKALDGKGGPPSIDDRERARRLRAAADAMLHTALAALRSSSERPSTGDREARSRRPV